MIENSEKIYQDLYFENQTPQQAIKYLKNIINKVPFPDKRNLVIGYRKENYNHPFREPDNILCLMVKKSKE